MTDRTTRLADLRQSIRTAISNAYYETREAGGTMEAAADTATANVMDTLAAAGVTVGGEGLRARVPQHKADKEGRYCVKCGGDWPCYPADLRRLHAAVEYAGLAHQSDTPEAEG